MGKINGEKKKKYTRKELQKKQNFKRDLCHWGKSDYSGHGNVAVEENKVAAEKTLMSYELDMNGLVTTRHRKFLLKIATVNQQLLVMTLHQNQFRERVRVDLRGKSCLGGPPGCKQ